MKVVVDDKIPYIRGRVEQLADEVVYLPGAAIGPEDVKDADALIVRTRTRCDRQLLEGSRVRFVVTATIGYDHLDTEYLREAGIQWTNCPGCNATSVAQYVRNALLEAEEHGLVRLSEATLGIVGYGHVGRAVCEAMRPYVREILINDPPLEVESSKFELSTLEALQASADIITLHTPLTFNGSYPTWHLVDEQFLLALRKRPILINAARGGVVDEAALLRAMDEGRVRQAIIDTWEGEPKVNRTLLDRVFIGTPHIAGYSANGKMNATRMSLEALHKFKVQSAKCRVQSLDAQPNFALCTLNSELAKPKRLCLYSPLADSARLKANPDGFEWLRGNYPERWE